MKNCIVALVTPMHLNGEIDYAALSALMEWHMAEGTEALVILGTTGESPTLTADERTALITHCVACAKKRLPIFVGTGTYDTRHSIALSQQAQALGADGLLIITPYYNKPTAEGLYLHFKAIHDAVDIPIILYNNPGRSACHLTLATLQRLGQLKNILGLKDSDLDLERIAAIQTAIPHKKFWLWSSNDSNSVAYVRAGGDGVISVLANMVPRAMRTLIQAALHHEDAATDTLHQKLLPLIQASELETNPIPIKWALHLMGKIPAGIRLPLTPLTPPHQAVMATRWQEFNR